MRRSSEFLFVDPSVSDLDTILGNLRPEVHAIVLDERWPAARQMAAALDGRHGLDAVHVIAHGAPGRVSFTSGDWSTTTLAQDKKDFSAIGRALTEDGELRLWSCDAAAGPDGAAFVDALALITGVDVAASTGRVGAAALGGTWALAAGVHPRPVRPPLTAAGMANFEQVLVAKSWTGGGTTFNPLNGNWSNSGNWSPSGVPVAGDDVTLGGVGGYTVTLDVNSAPLDSLTM
jgi:hypothetical protein